MRAPGPQERIVEGSRPTLLLLNWMQSIMARVAGMPPQTLGTAAPTTGTWRQGDIVWNSAPTAGQPLLWACTVAGTPGTWVGLTLS